MGHRISWLVATCLSFLSAGPLLAAGPITEEAASEASTLRQDVLDCAAFQNVMADAFSQLPHLAGWEEAVARAEEQRDQFIGIGTMLTRILNQKPTAAMTGYFLAKEKLEGEVELNSSNYSFLLSRYAPTCTVIAEETAPRIDGWLSSAQNMTDHGAATELN